ncbi:hypothetical protein GCK72_017639 [Caenorhabditis remanei]|uniref:Uncharacterized protein n=1 Tax=Caenorhabditis remanei TaxID=31234 RepID=A0A6A5G7U7_CAERE|nr:hypothetical protein GCK72_017639 [Caenorhabditis remanei]KAF1751087.1 hypothetical protein GCK72_017639 [Caenorhabditis remanei]
MSDNCHHLEGKVAIVTAATKGIGLAIAERLLAEGASVVIGKKESNKVAGIAGHIENTDDQQKLVHFTLQKFGKINVLVNNHGINLRFGHILKVSDQVWDKLFEVNVKAGFQMTKLVAPHIAKEGGGSIVFNSSLSAYKSQAGIAAYGITKTALIGLTRALAMGLAKDNIRVNGIAPGLIKTEMSRPYWEGGEEMEKGLIESQDIALGRLGVPEDCAGTVAYLASEDSSYITGETIIITGGVQARL